MKEGAVTGAYGKRIKELIDLATQHPEEYSKVAAVQKKVEEVKAVMTDNIGARAPLLVPLL